MTGGNVVGGKGVGAGGAGVAGEQLLPQLEVIEHVMQPASGLTVPGTDGIGDPV